MRVKKVAVYVVLAFVLFTIIKSPDRSTELVGVAFTAISDAANGLGGFLTNLVN